MSKHKGYRPDVMTIDKVIPEEVKDEVVQTIDTTITESISEKVKEPKEEIKPVDEPQHKKPVYTVKQAGEVIPLTLNVRKSPSRDAEIIKVIRRNDDVEILDESTADGWLPVLIKGSIKGYCMSEFIKLNN